MSNYHQEYVDKFIEIGREQLNELNFEISVPQVDGSGGAHMTRILLSHKSGIEFYVEFQDNRLDYTSGVMLYKAQNGHYDIYNSVLPKKNDHYEYIMPNRDTDIKRLVNDFCKLPLIKQLKKEQPRSNFLDDLKNLFS